MTIYETDTDRTLIYSGSAWLPVAYPGAWRSYSATLISGGSGTDWAIGNGTIDSFYFRQSNLVTVKFQIVWGSTSTFGTKFLNISLPFNSSISTGSVVGSALAKDVSLGITYNVDIEVPLNRAAFGAIATSDGRGNYGTWDEVDSTVPFTWASTDILQGSFTYEVA
jgi:hypothetical protein